MQSIQFTDSEFTIKNKTEWRNQPEREWAHRLKTRDHMEYIELEKLFDVTDSRWGKKTIEGEVVYFHMYQGCEFIVRLKTADGGLTLTHNEDGAFDRHLMNNPGETTVYSITSSNNGLESSHTFSVSSAGLASIPIIMACIVMGCQLANGIIAALAANAAEAEVAVATGLPVSVTVWGVGLALAVLAFIGVWVAYAIGREIMLNLIYENRSAKKTIRLVDHYVYNIGDNGAPLPATLKPLKVVDPIEYYSDVVVCIDNSSKYKGIGVSLKFAKDDDSFVIICIRNDIYKDPHYTIKAFPASDKTTAQNVYDNCTGGLVTDDFPWDDDLVIKNGLDKNGFTQYNFAGIISFHDK